MRHRDGGRTSPGNAQGLCQRCNQGRETPPADRRAALALPSRQRGPARSARRRLPADQGSRSDR
ncbi:hypothetical protein [Serinicoccus marinus]|uniref:hypothetical protein n=1 Tax=Serinicoccus marinus TaxID=247333 RepID=UPI0013764AD4